MSDARGPEEHQPDRQRLDEDVALSRRLRDLNRRIGESRPAVADPAEGQERRPGVGMALRLGADFVAGVIVGAAVGWGFDYLLGTSPWGLMVFLLAGFAAGLLSVMRTAGLIARRPGIDDDPGSRRPD